MKKVLISAVFKPLGVPAAMAQRTARDMGIQIMRTADHTYIAAEDKDRLVEKILAEKEADPYMQVGELARQLDRQHSQISLYVRKSGAKVITKGYWSYILKEDIPKVKEYMEIVRKKKEETDDKSKKERMRRSLEYHRKKTEGEPLTATILTADEKQQKAKAELKKRLTINFTDKQDNICSGLVIGGTVYLNTKIVTVKVGEDILPSVNYGQVQNLSTDQLDELVELAKKSRR
jgi:hypothetical protein